jgi:hypothetical protein
MCSAHAHRQGITLDPKISGLFNQLKGCGQHRAQLIQPEFTHQIQEVEMRHLLLFASLAARTIVGLALAVAASGVARAATITGPTLSIPDSGYTVSGLGFQALDNSRLTGFTFQNQGHADTVSLTNSTGTILDSVSIPASTPSDAVSVNWSLTTDNTYYLLQTGGVNGLYGSFGFTLPSDADIAITTTFNGGFTVVGAIGSYDVGSYWGDFNNITTSATPLPAALPLFASGFTVMGLLAWRRKRQASAVIAAA